MNEVWSKRRALSFVFILVKLWIPLLSIWFEEGGYLGKARTRQE